MRTNSLAAAARIGTILVLFAHAVEAAAAELRIMAVGPFTALLKDLGPQFERDTGYKLIAKFGPPPALNREIDAGESFDLAISIASAVDDWIKEGKIVASTRAAIGYAGVGVGVRAGSSRPDISSIEASRRTLLNARSVAYGAEGASSSYFEGLLKRLGIVEEMKPKLRPMVTNAALKSVASGEVELVVFSVPTIVSTPGIDLVGPFPLGLQNYLRFTAGVSTRAAEPEAAQALIKFLTSPAAVAALTAKGIQPGAP